MKSNRWGWVLLGGLVAELLIFAIAIPIAIFAGERSLLYTAPSASLIATFLCGCVVAKKEAFPSRQSGLPAGTDPSNSMSLASR